MIGLNKVDDFQWFIMALSYDWMEGGDNKGVCYKQMVGKSEDVRNKVVNLAPRQPLHL
jgi:hypothetical protein